MRINVAKRINRNHLSIVSDKNLQKRIDMHESTWRSITDQLMFDLPVVWVLREIIGEDYVEERPLRDQFLAYRRKRKKIT